MKITNAKAPGATSIGPGGARPPGQGFSVPDSDMTAGAAAAAQSTGVQGVGSLDALLALQQVDDPLTKRQRAVKRAGRLLDLLDEVKLDLMSEEPAVATLERLAAAVREERGAADDPELQHLLDQIETRAVVELAKAGR